MIGRAVAAAILAALLLAAPALGDDNGKDVVARSAEAIRTTAYAGEALWITFTADRPYVTTVGLAANGDGETLVEGHDGKLVRLGDANAGFDHRAEGWATPLPGALDDFDTRMAVLERNYDLVVAGREPLLNRPCTVVAFQRRVDDTLRERLWIDDDTGLPLRRETYAPDGDLVRLGTFLSLDLDPAPADAPEAREGFQAVVPVEEEELETLRKAGWVVPAELPGGYEALGAFAVDAGDAQPLQVVYADGLYTVSVFQQAGSADWDSLPPGSRLVEDLPGEVFEWPGALPYRLVWSVDGRTWSLVGDAPPDDLRAIAAALPMADAPGVLERLRRGFSRLWSGVSEWGRNLVELTRASSDL